MWIENEYYDNGQLKEHKEIIDDKKNGKYKYYYENGQLAQDTYYKNGELEGDFKTFYKNGNLQEIGIAIDGEVDGKYLRYHENGKVWKEQYFKLGKKHGLSKRYYENGNLRDSGDYIDDRKDGYWKEYDEKGFGWEGNYIGVPDKDNYVIKEKNGVWKFYDVNKDGTHFLSKKGKYLNGKREGEWNDYLADGSKGDIEIYKNGEIVKHINNGKHYIIEEYSTVGHELWEEGKLIKTVRYDEEEKVYKINFRNKTNDDVDLLIRILNKNNKWENHGWYYLDPGETAYLEDTKNRILYYYAESKNKVWKGKNNRAFNGEKYPMKKFELAKGKFGHRIIPLNK
mgnify:CR=1 FL=1